ncbi:MAG: CcdB family protein [Alphaproteobacteria bacterium]|nr:CcdB family protein [Alphaproteobacteria bacterium]
MQHDVFANPAPRSRASYPFLAVLQADLSAERDGRIVAPMAPVGALTGSAGRLLPVVEHAGQKYYLILELMTSLPRHVLRNPLGSVATFRDEITRALDWLFTGV